MKIHLSTATLISLGSTSRVFAGGDQRTHLLRRNAQASINQRELVVANCPGTESFEVTFEGHCTYENVRNAVNGLATEDCTVDTTATPDAILTDLLKAANVDDASSKVKELCKSAYQNSPEKFAFGEITQKGNEFDNEFFSGGTTLNYEVQTNDGDSELKTDAQRVRRIKDDQAESKLIDLPTYLPAFGNDDGQCDLNAAFCCWVQDRQANDNNGNCNTPYDSQCIDKDPGDNTNFCYIDHDRSPAANNVAGGFSVFGNIENGAENIEGAVHCHGFAWAQDETDESAAYKGNNLFFVSMFDHMYQRGYVRNAPGAPMCACAENMPVVTRSDCTEIEAKETFTFNYDSTAETLSGILSEVRDIDFNACQGPAGNNDLDSYYQQLVADGKQTQANLDELRKILVGDNDGQCNQAIKDFMATKGIVPSTARKMQEVADVGNSNSTDPAMWFEEYSHEKPGAEMRQVPSDKAHDFDDLPVDTPGMASVGVSGVIVKELPYELPAATADPEGDLVQDQSNTGGVQRRASQWW